MHSYTAYGLDIQSDQALSYLSVATPSQKSLSKPKITVDFSGQLPETLKETNGWSSISSVNSSVPDAENLGNQVLRKQHWTKVCFNRNAGSNLTFYVSAKDRHILSQRSPDIPFTDAESFLIGPILGCLHRLLGNTCLHASVLSYNGHALALVGAKAAGKSTASAALLEAGSSLLSDDIAVLELGEDGVTVAPGYPAIRLLPNSLGQYSKNFDRWSNVLSIGDKKIIPLPNDQLSWQFDALSRPLSAIYILQPRDNTIDSVEITELSASQSVIELVPHGYATSVAGFKERANEFDLLATLARTIPVKSLTCDDRLSALPSIASDILSDFSNTR